MSTLLPRHAVRGLALASLLCLGLTACHGKSATDGGGTQSSPSVGAASTGEAGSAGKTVSVDVRNFAFTPQNVTVAKGGTVTWKFDDDTDHNVDFNGKTSPNLQGGKTYSMTFNTPGTYDYVCGIHNYMTGKVVVK